MDIATLQESFRDNTRRRLREMGMTQTELARQLGTSHAYVSVMLSGKHAPTTDTIERVAKILGVNGLWIVTPIAAENLAENSSVPA